MRKTAFILWISILLGTMLFKTAVSDPIERRAEARATAQFDNAP